MKEKIMGTTFKQFFPPQKKENVCILVLKSTFNQKTLIMGEIGF